MNLKERLEGCEDRYRTLLEINNAIVSNLHKDRLFKVIAEQIKKVFPFDRAGITLYDPARDCFRIYVLETTVSPLHLTWETEIPHSGSAIGWVLDQRRYHLRSDLAKERLFFEDDFFYREGLRSILNLPLITRGEVIGTLNLAGKSPAGYSEEVIELLSLIADQIAIAMDNARAYEEIRQLKDRLDQENVYLQDEIKTEYNFEEIVGKSQALKKVLRGVEKVAGTDSSVLIFGETGTGKELIARAIHDLSKRKNRPLIKVNCAALATGLIESELFGHEKGSFTGALSRKIGRFELADGGTLFLDEIGDLPPEVQAKLLRVLQEHELERVGGTQTLKVDVRLIAATNRDLEKAVSEKTFRADLYYRLNVFPIALPPLRGRKEDIPLLTEYFIHKYAMKMGKRIEKIRQETMNRLISYPWPGNIRELENVIERAVILSKGPTLEIEDALLPPSDLPHRNEKGLLPLEEVEREHILKTLEATRWVIEGPKGAAGILGLHPNTLRSRLQKLGIKRNPHGIS
ncbi:sigma 54-interacting transcriptional regulator [Candidatus Manganitrophus noduliformans]|uniref:GAF domain-containing protein n=1 Tax=Candidatus Manganitrophus noduliformans TaxID=2606439 RepID=A0A7X6DN87_9BACT|nr:sigma 54-interacting transcriptional regulator [Candidatus Manganitrophus noduliformans]NKE70280.1 GAF domain-containing protein [Candidatus Manganitrophus noduliformans]